MYKKIGLFIVLMLLITAIPITTSVNSIGINEEYFKLQREESRWYHRCYIEIEGVTYAAHRNLFLPHFLGTNYTLCLYWNHRFEGNATISIYQMKGGSLLHEQSDLQEFHMFGFFGIYNYQRDPFILKGRTLAIKTYDDWTVP